MKTRIGLCALAALCLASSLLPSARAQSRLAPEIARAESLFVSGQVDAPLQLLSASMSEATTDEAVRIYRLLILSYLQKGASDDAATTAVQLLHRAPDYWPDTATDPPEYVHLLNGMRAVLFAPNPQPVSCQQEIDAASAHYVEGAYADAEFLLSDCLNRNLMYLPETEYVPALRLLTLLYVKAGNIPQARYVADRLLALKPDYTPDPVQDPPAYVALVEILKRTGRH